ncbi:hypothetical protein C9374_004112 [Naegleria lovaniensis]|uniref:Uncharacterized protein n=1 Tax=Naegleria lovaniensis TaxID=51637 RepID=A0AA88GQG7_NAELO|nr:uncharacterized protein C9374_004112 [Naegleria lovaniensis]KAG2383441.1 hypothetical protein C9374_004112 [Naegleria lovaniensis]
MSTPLSLRWEHIPYSTQGDNLPTGGGISHTIIDEYRFAVFGGLGSRRYNELYIFNTRSNEWLKASMENAPSRRCKASLCCREIQTLSPKDSTTEVVKNYKLYVFGGWTNEGKTNDLYEYDVAQDEWKQLKPNNASSCSPPERSAHSCAVVGKYMYLYGGIGNKKYGDMYRYHFEKNEWECVNSMKGDVPLPRSSYGGLITLVGSIPSMPQFLVTCGLVSFSVSNRVLIKTNKAAGSECSGECFSFNTSTNEWKLLKQINPPPKRESACCVILNHKLYMFGGWGGDAKFFNDMHVATFE